MLIHPKEITDLFPILDREGSLELLNNDKVLFAEGLGMLFDLLKDIRQDIFQINVSGCNTKLQIKLEQLNEAILYIKLPKLRRALSKPLRSKFNNEDSWQEIEYEINAVLQTIINLKANDPEFISLEI